MTCSTPKQLRDLIATDDAIAIPGCHDCITAAIVEEKGFDAVYLTGFGAEASLIGSPDADLATMDEIVDHARNIASTIDIPLLLDADIGFGSAIAVARAVDLFEAAGVAGIHLEDQEEEAAIGDPVDEMVGKVRRATKARSNNDFVIIARTTSKNQDMGEVISRLKIYGNAGADVAMVADKCTADEINQLVYEVDLPIVLCSGVPEVTIDLTIKEFDDLGVDIVLFTASSVFLAAHAVRRAYDSLNSTERKSDKIASTEQLNDLLGVPHWRDLETRTMPER